MSKFFAGKESGFRKGPTQRQLQVGEAVRSVLARQMLEEDFYGTLLQGVSITVSEVRISPDLKNATAYVVPLGGKAPEGFLKALNELAPKFRYVIGKTVNLRYTPRVLFRLDDSFEEAEKIHSLLENLE